MRENGYYFVKVKGESDCIIAEYKNDTWLIPSDSDDLMKWDNDNYFTEIDERRITKELFDEAYLNTKRLEAIKIATDTIEAAIKIAKEASKMQKPIPPKNRISKYW